MRANVVSWLLLFTLGYGAALVLPLDIPWSDGFQAPRFTTTIRAENPPRAALALVSKHPEWVVVALPLPGETWFPPPVICRDDPPGLLYETFPLCP